MQKALVTVGLAGALAAAGCGSTAATSSSPSSSPTPKDTQASQHAASDHGRAVMACQNLAKVADEINSGVQDEAGSKAALNFITYGTDTSIEPIHSDAEKFQSLVTNGGSNLEVGKAIFEAANDCTNLGVPVHFNLTG